MKQFLIILYFRNFLLLSIYVSYIALLLGNCISLILLSSQSHSTYLFVLFQIELLFILFLSHKLVFNLSHLGSRLSTLTLYKLLMIPLGFESFGFWFAQWFHHRYTSQGSNFLFLILDCRKSGFISLPSKFEVLFKSSHGRDPILFLLIILFLDFTLARDALATEFTTWLGGIIISVIMHVRQFACWTSGFLTMRVMGNTL